MTALTSHGRPASAGVRVVVTVGTDHHPFDRLVCWVNDWLTAHPEQLPGFFVQSGSTVVAPVCAGSKAVDAQRLSGLLDSADVIVCHGGPASIAAAWDRDLLPIVVPRLPQLGEHVDDHQVTFSRKVADLGRIRLAQTPREFTGVMAEATCDPSSLRGVVPTGDADAAVARFGELVDGLIGQPRRRLAKLRPARKGLF
jgi:UDP-N-acetylglucosamine transferase subunit ALG13